MRRVTRILWSTAAALLFAGYAALTAWERHWYLAAIPAAVTTSGTVEIDGQAGFIEGCGVAICKLSEDSAKQIRDQGLKFFESARQARGHAGIYYAYEPWRETPIAGGFTERSELLTLVTGMSCASLGSALQKQIAATVEAPGSYFTAKREGALLVSPALRLVVFAYFG